MWFKRILASLMGVRSSKDLADDLNNFSIPKFIILFIKVFIINFEVITNFIKVGPSNFKFR